MVLTVRIKHYEKAATHLTRTDAGSQDYVRLQRCCIFPVQLWNRFDRHSQVTRMHIGIGFASPIRGVELEVPVHPRIAIVTPKN